MKTFFKRLLAIPIFLFGLFMLVGGTYANLFIKLPMSLSSSSGSGAAGIILGTILGTATLIAISYGILYGSYELWKKD